MIVCVTFTRRRCVDHVHGFRYRPKLGAARQVLGVIGAIMTHFRAIGRQGVQDQAPCAVSSIVDVGAALALVTRS